MTLCGKYVATFAEASHALPSDMHMSADYPFMLPRIVGIDDGRVIIEGRDGQRETFRIDRSERGERGFILQSSTFEQVLGRKPRRFVMRPFKDDSTPAISASRAGGTV